MSERVNSPSWIEQAPALLWRAVRGRGCVWVGPQWTAYTGLSEAESLGRGWLDAIHPDDRAPTVESFAVAPDEGYQFDHRIRAAAGGYRWHRTRATIADEWSGASFDIDDLRRHGEVLASDLAESRRRLRMSFGLLRALARRTAETSGTIENFAMHFEGRLDALARVQGRIARGGGSVLLETLVAEELAAFLAREDGRISLAGPSLRVGAGTAETLGLLFHELGANAVKFGALSPLGGRLAVTWTVDPEALRIAWVESEVPLGAKPQKDGFGADLVKRGLAHRLQARADFDLRPDGLACRVEIPHGPAGA